MYGKLRYLVVIAAAALVISGVLIATAPGRKTAGETSEYGSDPLFSVSDLNAAFQGNPYRENTEEAPVFMVGTMEDAEVLRKTSSEASSAAPSVQEISEEPADESPETPPVPEAPPSETEEPPASEEPVSETEEEEGPSGLRLFFSDKLVINFSKVELYLNVRE